MSQVITEELEEALAMRGADIRSIGHIPHRVCVLSGPNLATEIMGEEPTASVVAHAHCPSQKLSRRLVPVAISAPTRIPCGGYGKSVVW